MPNAHRACDDFHSTSETRRRSFLDTPLATSGDSDVVPLVAAAVALVAAAGYLFSIVGRRGHRPTIRRA